MTEHSVFAKTEKVQTTLRPDDRKRLDEIAEARKVSRADLIRFYVLAGMRARPHELL